jgi:hypothetical protein
MKNTKKIMKGASVLLIAAVMILSTLAVTANTNDVQKQQGILEEVSVTAMSLSTNKISYSNTLQTGVFFDGFEDYPDFVVDDFPPWNTVDLDGDATYGMTGVEWLNAYYTGAYMVFNPSQTNPPIDDSHPAFSGEKYASCWASVSMPNNDWLISPAFTLEEDGTFSFWARSLTDEYGLERMKVGVSTTDMEPSSFEIISTGAYIEVPVAWTQYTYDLSDYNGETVYLAINCVSDDAFSLFIDDFEVTGVAIGQPELGCSGSLAWTGVTPGDNVTGSFNVNNIGDAGTVLNWEIESFPDWGTWTFTPSSGATTATTAVDVEVIAPMDQETEFTGEVKIINSDNASEFCIIDVALATPVSLLSQAKPFSFAKTQAGAFLPLMALTWLHYDDGTNVNSIGLTDGGYFEWGIRLTPDELSNYDGKELTTVKFHHGWVDSPAGTDNGNIYVYEAGTPTSPGAQIPSATTPWEHTGSDWLEVTLLNPVVVDGTADLWITIDVDHAAGDYPAGVGPGPMVAGKGGWISLDGVAWDQLGDFGLDYNWNLWAGIDDGGSPPLVPDLTCEGSLSWADVEPGSTVTGSFVVENIGNATSLLNWEVQTYPTWGNWTITPASGVGLTPEDGPLTINVEVIAPDDPETDFTGEIIIVNSDDADDTCTVDVVLATPVSYQSPFMVFIQRLVQRFPVLGFIINLL